MSKPLKPQIRFKGYEDEWQLKSLGDVCHSFKYGLNAAATTYDGKHKYLRITDIDDDNNTFNKGDLTSPNITCFTDEYKLSVKDIVFARTGASVGKTYLYDANDGNVYWAGFLIKASVNQNYDENFVFQNTLTNRYWRYIGIASQRSGQPGVNATEYGEFDFHIAPNINEQREIGEYFSNLDTQIKEAEREVDRLEKMKIASLQKMFPRPGATAPEIRFAGFSEPWKVCTFGDICSFSRGQGYTKSDLRKSGVPIFLYGRLYTSYSSYVKEVDTFSYMTSFAVMSKGSEVVMPSSGETAADIAVASAILSPGIILGGGLNILYPNKNMDSIFLALMLTYGQPHYDVANRAQGKSVVHIYNDDIKQTSLMYPSLDEQRAIGEYFRNLDELISAKRKSIVKLRNIKKACLSKMFVNDTEL